MLLQEKGSILELFKEALGSVCPTEISNLSLWSTLQNSKFSTCRNFLVSVQDHFAQSRGPGQTGDLSMYANANHTALHQSCPPIQDQYCINTDICHTSAAYRTDGSLCQGNKQIEWT